MSNREFLSQETVVRTMPSLILLVLLMSGCIFRPEMGRSKPDNSALSYETAGDWEYLFAKGLELYPYEPRHRHRTATVVLIPRSASHALNPWVIKKRGLTTDDYVPRIWEVNSHSRSNQTEIILESDRAVDHLCTVAGLPYSLLRTEVPRPRFICLVTFCGQDGTILGHKLVLDKDFAGTPDIAEAIDNNGQKAMSTRAGFYALLRDLASRK
jgi:hypothetical protein